MSNPDKVAALWAARAEQIILHEREVLRRQSFKGACRGLIACLALCVLSFGSQAWAHSWDLISLIGVSVPTILFAGFTYHFRPRSS